MSNHWKIFAAQTLKLEKKYIPRINSIIQQYKQDFADSYTNDSTRALSDLHTSLVSQDMSPLMVDIYRTAGLLGAKITWSELRQAAKQKSAAFGRNEQWIAEVMGYLNRFMFRFLQSISETIRQDILKVIDKAVEEGWGVEETAKRILAENISIARARVIARTEIIRAANVGHSVAAQDTPYEVDKEWSAAGDHRTRHSHRFIDGHITDEFGTFKVPVYRNKVIIGYDEMQYPGDPTATPGNTINCRCRVLYVPKRDENGRLVMRRQNTARIIPIHSNISNIPAHQIAAALKANIKITVD